MNRPCKWSGCPAIVGKGDIYCSKHSNAAEQRRADNQRSYDKFCRNKEQRKLYHIAIWRKGLRKQVLQEQPICAICKSELSWHVDHIKPLATNPELALERENLQGLCHKCHNRKSAKERRK